MQRITTIQMVQVCKEISNQYDTMCRSFFGKPSKAAIQRKVDFLILVSKLQNQTPNEAFVLLYHFYCRNNHRSRLLFLLMNFLASCVRVTIPRFISSRHGGNASEIQDAIELFERRADRICEPFGVNPNESGTLLTGISTRVL